MTKQEKMFHDQIVSFIGESSDHRKILHEYFGAIENMAIDHWLKGKNFPIMEFRIRIIDFIWNHHCYCECS